MLERQHLLILRETERLGSLTLAAEVLNLSQSALSHSMRRLEERSGVKLWEKEGRGLRLTEAGHYMLGVAQRLLPQFEDADRVLREFQRGRRGTLRAGMECHPCQHWLMRVIAPYLQAWPRVDLDLRRRFEFGGFAALLDHEIDVLITPDPQDHPDLLFTRIFGYELVLAVPEGHAIGPVATPQDLCDEVLITYPVPVERLDLFTRFLIPARCHPRALRQVEDTTMMLQLVASGRGISAVPDWLLREAGQGLALRGVRAGDGLDMALYMGLRRGDAGVDYLAGFLAQAQACAASPSG